MWPWSCCRLWLSRRHGIGGLMRLTRSSRKNTKIAILFSDHGSGNHLTSILKICFQAFGVAGALCAVGGVTESRPEPDDIPLAQRLPDRGVSGGCRLRDPHLAGCLCDPGQRDRSRGTRMDKATTLVFWWNAAWPALAVAAYAAWLHVMLRSRSVYAAFSGETGGADEGRPRSRGCPHPRP